MSNAVFEFREFAILQDKCAMKVGTDGVLLGAWCQPSEGGTCRRILDIGTGTGVIALMCAQRWQEATVEAVEIDREAAAQAAANFSRSPWGTRLRVHACSLAQFHASFGSQTYDLIVSNPPFYNASLLPDDGLRALARHTNALPWSELTAIAARHLSPDGRLCVVFPTSEWDKVATAALLAGLSPVLITDVVTKTGKAPKRTLAAFSSRPCVPQRTLLTVRDSSGAYTDDYLRLVLPFYEHL